MPSLSHRRESDGRAPRFESEVRIADGKMQSEKSKRIFSCSKCHRMFEEKSRHCPRCESLSMGEIKKIPEKYLAQAREKSLGRLREKYA